MESTTPSLSALTTHCALPTHLPSDTYHLTHYPGTLSGLMPLHTSTSMRLSTLRLPHFTTSPHSLSSSWHCRRLTSASLPISRALHLTPSTLPAPLRMHSPLRVRSLHTPSLPPSPASSSPRWGRRSLFTLVILSSLTVMIYHTPSPAEAEEPKPTTPLSTLIHSLNSYTNPTSTTPSPSIPADVTAAAAGANLPASHREPGSKPRLVILGSGWGAVSMLKGLDRDAYEVTVVSPRNYFLFTPLLPSATTGQVESRSLMEPIRRICHRVGAHYYESKATDVDPVQRVVHCRSFSGLTFTLPYDHLIVAVGAKNNTFGTPGVNEYTYFLKEIKHARKIRHKLLSLLEEASLPGLTKEQRERMLHFVVVGGGPDRSGVRRGVPRPAGGGRPRPLP